MFELETYSRNGGEELLKQKGVVDDIHEIPSIWTEHAGQSNYSERSTALDRLGGWETEVQIDLGPDEWPHNERLTPFLDVYHPNWYVAVEHERKEQMRARWHLMKMQAAHERDETLDIDVGVLIFPTDEDPSLRRTRRELEGPFFTDHFPIHLPVYAVEYAKK
ncbi:MAG: hypothetical protein ABEI76_02620 [Halobacteriales archaeon]